MSLLPSHVTPASGHPRRRPAVERVACWSARHRKIAVAGWLAFVAAAFIISHFMPASHVQQYDPGSAGVAEQELTQLHVVSPPTESVLITVRHAAHGAAVASAADVRSAADDVVRVLTAAPEAATNIRAPYRPGGSSLVSANHLSALVTFDVGGPNSKADRTVLTDMAATARVQAQYPRLLVAEAGSASTDRAANALLGHDFHQAEFSSVPLTLVLLIGVFGALIAAGIPVLLAGTAVTAAVSLLSIPAQWLPVSTGSSEIVLVIGMAVGVDYSLFYLRREREERVAGNSQQASLRIAAATSGKAIVVSGLTVVISLAGLFLTGIDLFTGLTFGTIMVVGVAVLGSLTFLPAMLSWLGPWADRGRVPFLGRRLTAANSSRLWTALARRVVRKPLAWGGIAIAALLALSAPALGMHIGNPSVDLPNSLGVVRVLDQIQQKFPGRPAPAQVVVTGSDLAGQPMHAALAALEARATAAGPIRGPIQVSPVAGGRALVVQVPLAGNGSNAASDNALLTLENKTLPGTVGRVAGASFAVTGHTADSYDTDSTLDARAPLVLGVVAGLAFLVLMAAFRSVTIPLVSIALNLLSVGAAYGLVTFIFQDGHLQGPLGFTSFGALVPWVPLFTFVLLFGLSMDYHVFILSRIREIWSGGVRPADAVVQGIGSSAGVVTSAAVIMVAVFSVFATLSMIDVKMLGVGLAAAVLVDATIVRGIILPAALALLGERAWYLPRWLGWLPGRGLACERHHASGAVPATPAEAEVPVLVGTAAD
jgi:RND superfamily putative drug exporter